MQTWARRGVQAALVTGGMIAAGTGVASATETCPSRPAPPLGETALSPANGFSRHIGIPCFAGELFPELHDSGAALSGVPRMSGSAAHPVTAMSGTLDLEPNLPPRPRHKQPSHARIVPADKLPATGSIDDGPGQHADLSTNADQPTVRLGRLSPADRPGRHASTGTPAQGFHRTLSWSGPIGNVLDDRAAAPAPRGLVRPGEDPAVFGGFDDADSIVELWQGALGRGGGVLAPETDLTDIDLSGPRPDVRTVPADLLDSSLRTDAPPPVERQPDLRKLPGEHLLKADELPNLRSDLALGDLSGAPVVDDVPGTQEPQPRDEPSLPVVSHITRALEGSSPDADQPPRFSRTPQLAGVAVTTVDALLAVTPPEQLIARNPFATGPRATTEPNLPVLEGGLLPHITAMRANAAIGGDGSNDVEATMPLYGLAGRF